MNEAVAEIIPLFRRNDLPELAFHLRRLFDPVDKTDEIAQADTVGIRDDRGFAENVAHDQIRALSPHAGKCQKLFKRLRHMIVVFFMQDPHTGTDITRLAAAETTGADDLLDLLRLRCRQCRDIREFFI